MLNDVQNDAKSRMRKSIDALKADMVKIRTGRAHPSLLDHVMVPYYGTDMPLNQVASVSVSDARTLAISAWEKNLVPVIEKAILKADLGLNPSTSGSVIRVPLPALTEERRKDLIKIVRGETENARVAIRNIRRDANHAVKELLKEKMIGEDDERHAEEMIQKLTDQFIKEADAILAAKESELMEV